VLIVHPGTQRIVKAPQYKAVQYAGRLRSSSCEVAADIQPQPQPYVLQSQFVSRNFPRGRKS
jgi:hypothetical protein